MLELRLVAEPLADGESERPDEISAAAAYRPLLAGGGRHEALAALGTAPRQNQAPAFGGHAGTETMGAHAPDFAGLVSAFHGLTARTRKRLQRVRSTPWGVNSS